MLADLLATIRPCIVSNVLGEFSWGKPMSSNSTSNELLEKLRSEFEENHKLSQVLLANIKKNRKKIKFLLKVVNDREGEYEGKVYRFYHYSFKVYHLHMIIKPIIEVLRACDPKPVKQFCVFFQTILNDAEMVGAWKEEHNKEWLKYTRPIVEAFLHAKYMLEMADLCDKLYRRAPRGFIDQKWGSLLELYEIR